MAATILTGTAQHTLGYPTPKPAPGTELKATSPQQSVMRKAYMAMVILENAAPAFIKLSCIFFLQHVLQAGSNRIVNMLIHNIVGLIIIWGFGYFFSFFFACQIHFNHFWTNLENQLKYTADLTMIQLSLSISDVIMDVILLVFLIPLVGIFTSANASLSESDETPWPDIFTLPFMYTFSARSFAARWQDDRSPPDVKGERSTMGIGNILFEAIM